MFMEQHVQITPFVKNFSVTLFGLTEAQKLPGFYQLSQNYD